MPRNDPSADDENSGFLSRWSRRKALVRQGQPLAEPAAAPPAPTPRALPEPAPAALAPLAEIDAPTAPIAPIAPVPVVAEAPAAPTLADVAALTLDSDYARFVAPGVDVGVKNAALKKLFTAPHFNVMDGLDTYIDDYGQPDPLPPGMLRQMAQSHALGLFADDPPEPEPAQAALAPAGGEAPAEPVAIAAAEPDLTPDLTSDSASDLSQDTPPDENADLRLQPHDAAGPARPGPGPGQGAGGEHRRD